MQPNQQNQGMNQIPKPNVPMGGTDPLVGGVRPVAQPAPVAPKAPAPVQAAPAPAPAPAAQPSVPVNETPMATAMAIETEEVVSSDPTASAEDLINAELNRANASESALNDAPAMTMPKQKKNLGMIIGMVVLAVVAVCGIGFGIITMIGKNQEAANYEKQISQLKQINNELLESEMEGGESEAGYIYLGNWGIKIAMPEEIQGSYAYTVDDGGVTIMQNEIGSVMLTRAEEGTVVCEEGVDAETGIANICPELITTIDGFDYFATVSEGVVGSTLESVLNPDNFTAF